MQNQSPSLTIYQSIWFNAPEVLNLQEHCCDNHKYQTVLDKAPVSPYPRQSCRGACPSDMYCSLPEEMKPALQYLLHSDGFHKVWHLEVTVAIWPMSWREFHQQQGPHIQLTLYYPFTIHHKPCALHIPTIKVKPSDQCEGRGPFPSLQELNTYCITELSLFGALFYDTISIPHYTALVMTSKGKVHPRTGYEGPEGE
jgi:hypothetical protein